MPAPEPEPLRVGVLALQGSFAEHLHMLSTLSTPERPILPLAVRTPAQLASVVGLILVGGESSAISLLIQKSALLEPLRLFVARARRGQGRAVWGTCAGMILLAEEVVGGKAGEEGALGFQGLNGVAVKVVRNQFGRQADSFSTPLALPFLEEPFAGIFIRAPMVHSIHPASSLAPPVEILARLPAARVPSKSQHPQADIGPDADVVMAKQGDVLMSSFHPELTGDKRVHEWWVGQVARVARTA